MERQKNPDAWRNHGSLGGMYWEYQEGLKSYDMNNDDVSLDSHVSRCEARRIIVDTEQHIVSSSAPQIDARLQPCKRVGGIRLVEISLTNGDNVVSSHPFICIDGINSRLEFPVSGGTLKPNIVLPHDAFCQILDSGRIMRNPTKFFKTPMSMLDRLLISVRDYSNPDNLVDLSVGSPDASQPVRMILIFDIYCEN